MQKPSVFQHQDYKEFLRSRIDEASNWGVISRFAEAAGCQRSFLSKVLNAHIQLTPEHGFRLCEYWKFSNVETEYFMALLEKARSSDPAYLRFLDQKLKSLRREQENITKKVNRPLSSLGEREMTYYSAWHWSAIHILVSIPDFRSVKAISQRLHLPESLVQSTLKALEGYGFISCTNGLWSFASSELHVSKSSPLVSLHHGNWRQRAVVDSQTPGSDGIHFTVVQSMSEKVYEKIKASLIQFIESASKEAGPSEGEELVCIACDAFRV